MTAPGCHCTLVTPEKMPEDPIREPAEEPAQAPGAEMTPEALRRFDALTEESLRETGAHLACVEGCSLCCWLRVDTYAHEVFLIAEHVRANFSKGEIEALMERLAAHSERVLPLTPLEHATRNIACPLLREGRCSVYAVRPLACRRQHSLSLAACQFTFDHPTDLSAPSDHHGELHAALSEAMRERAAHYAELGYDVTIYELGTALEEALSDPESWESWRGRLEAFVRASITPTGDFGHA